MGGVLFFVRIIPSELRHKSKSDIYVLKEQKTKNKKEGKDAIKSYEKRIVYVNVGFEFHSLIQVIQIKLWEKYCGNKKKQRKKHMKKIKEKTKPQINIKTNPFSKEERCLLDSFHLHPVFPS